MIQVLYAIFADIGRLIRLQRKTVLGLDPRVAWNGFELTALK